VVKLVGQPNCSLDQQRGREKRGTAYRRGRRRRRFRELGSGEGGEWWLRPMRGRRCLGRPFYRCPREGERRSSAGAGEVHSAGINAAQRRRRDLTAEGGGGYRRVHGQATRTGGAKLSCAARGWARGRRWRARRQAVREEDDEAADWWGRSASGRGHARESGWQVGLARQREREREREAERLRARETGRKWAERGRNAGARGGGTAAAHGLDSAQQGGRGFSLFLFIF
jgi:hypothetical protein